MEEFQSGIKKLRGEAKSKDILRLPLGPVPVGYYGTVIEVEVLVKGSVAIF